MAHVEALSNGLGSQSLYMCVLAAEGKIPATVSITADTGAENDRLRSDGRRTTAAEYYRDVVEPFCHENHIQSFFVRAVNRERKPLAPLGDYLRDVAKSKGLGNLKIPVFGSNGGRLRQSCTQRWKITAINQQLRRLGAITARTAQGIHFGEAARRISGKFLGNIDGFDTYATTEKRNGQEKVIKWLRHYYPLVDARIHREDTREALTARGIVYLESSECDFCPHQDWPRWSRHTPESLEESAELEAAFNGEFFLSDVRKPLAVSLPILQGKWERKPRDLDFGCGNSYCGV